MFKVHFQIFRLKNFQIQSGGLAQLARALDLHSRGQGFDSLILHERQFEDLKM